MADREKVVKGLETCSDVYYGADGACSSCPYSHINGDKCLSELVHDAIDLLKEQETVKPEVYFVGPDQYRFYRCPVCKTAWFYKGKYCPECGKAVKWK